jgi:signal transduction histidine kinase
MDETYHQELRADTSQIVFPIFSVLTVFASLGALLAVNSLEKGWPFLLYGVLAPLVGRLTKNLYQREKGRLGGSLFISLHVVMLTLIIVQNLGWELVTQLPYLYGLLIVMSSMVLFPLAGLITWGSASALLLVGTFLAGGSLAMLGLLLLPVAVNLLLAGASFLTAVEWQTAVESTSYLHRRVQQRRDELFAIQEELSQSNARLKYLNAELDLARQQAENERDIRTRFMNNVSHELRTPLNAIVNFAHILMLGGRGAITEEQSDYLQRIEQSGWHLLDILNDLLDMAQIESGEFKLHREKTHLYHICEEAMSSTRGLLLEKEVDLVRDYPEEWPTVYVDQMRLKQALINLLGNAAKYTEKGHIALRVQIEVDLVRIVVEDTGIGIPPEFHEAIFKEFRQVDETAARKRIGTGLGLPITRHLIERHGGSLSLVSEVGVGSAFMITLPLAGEEVEQPGLAPEDALELKPITAVADLAPLEI